MCCAVVARNHVSWRRAETHAWRISLLGRLVRRYLKKTNEQQLTFDIIRFCLLVFYEDKPGPVLLQGQVEV